jgi:ribosomal protein L40E
LNAQPQYTSTVWFGCYNGAATPCQVLTFNGAQYIVTETLQSAYYVPATAQIPYTETLTQTSTGLSPAFQALGLDPVTFTVISIMTILVILACAIIWIAKAKPAKQTKLERFHSQSSKEVNALPRLESESAIEGSPTIARKAEKADANSRVPTTVICSQCGATIAGNSRFCKECGTKQS